MIAIVFTGGGIGETRVGGRDFRDGKGLVSKAVNPV
jgi:hypothetical protein